MSETVFGFLSGLPMNWIVFFASAIPITELRAAIPFGIAGGMTPFSAWVWGVLGNLLPIPFILYMWPLIYKIFDAIPFTRGVLHRFVDKSREKGKTIEKKGTIGLTVFVGIPLPVTGVWTGSLISFFLGLKPLRAAAAMALGAMISGTIVTLITVGFVNVAGSVGVWGALAALLIFFAVVYAVYKIAKKRKKS